MRKLGTLPLAIECKQYTVSFSYATPRELDVFALVLLKAVESKDLQLKGATLQSVLIDLGFSKDLHSMFESRLRKLISINLINYARCMPIPIGNALKDKSVNRQMIEVVKAIIADISAKTILMSALRLTSRGEEAIAEMQFLSEEKYGKVTLTENAIDGTIRLASEIAECGEIEKQIVLCKDNAKEQLTIAQIDAEINEHKCVKKWINDGNAKTKIFDAEVVQIEKVKIPTSLDIVEVDGEIQLGDECDESIRNMIADECNEKEIKLDKFKYINGTSQFLTNAKCKVFCPINIQYKGIIAHQDALDCFSSDAKNKTDEVYRLIQEECLMIGVLKSNNSGVVVKYAEVNICGILVPIVEEFSTNDEEGMAVFSDIYRNLIFKIIDIDGEKTSMETVELMNSITPEYYEKWLAVQVDFIINKK